METLVEFDDEGAEEEWLFPYPGQENRAAQNTGRKGLTGRRADYVFRSGAATEGAGGGPGTDHQVPQRIRQTGRAAPADRDRDREYGGPERAVECAARLRAGDRARRIARSLPESQDDQPLSHPPEVDR